MAGARAKKARLSFGTSMGVSSIIAILVILVLVVFSALSITTSKADLTLSQKTSASVKAYYEADATAEDIVAEIAAMAAKNGAWQSEARNAGLDVSADKSGGTLVSYTIPVDEFRNLSVVILVSPDGKLSREVWHTVPANPWVPDNSINLFMPDS